MSFLYKRFVQINKLLFINLHFIIIYFLKSFTHFYFCKRLKLDYIRLQRINIKFCFEVGKSATETLKLLKMTYGNNYISFQVASTI